VIVLIVIALTKGDDKYLLSGPSSRVPIYWCLLDYCPSKTSFFYIFLEEGTLFLATSSKVEVSSSLLLHIVHVDFIMVEVQCQLQELCSVQIVLLIVLRILLTISHVVLLNDCSSP